MKKKILLICTLLISFIIYTNVVDAATNLNCVYTTGTTNELKFTQDSSGNLTFFIWDSSNTSWKEVEVLKIKNKGTESEYYDKKSKSYTSCPASAQRGADTFSKYRFNFNSKKKSNYIGYNSTGEINMNETEKWNHYCKYGDGSKYLNVYFDENDKKIVGPDGIEITNVTAQLFDWDMFNMLYTSSCECPSKIYKSTTSTFNTKDVYTLTRSAVSDTITSVYYYVEGSKPDNCIVDNGSGVEDIESCAELLSPETIEKINDIMKLLGIIAPILLLVFGIIDFLKATFASEEETMTKAKKKFVKRLFAAVLLFLVPTFVNLVLELTNNVWSFISPETCIK